MANTDRIDRFLVMHAARADQWREVLSAAQDWAAGSGNRAKVEAELSDIAVIEELHAYPGVRLMARLRERIASGEADAVASMVRRIADAILTSAYAQQTDGDGAGDGDDGLPDVLPSVVSGREHHRPYFEVLFVTAQPPARWGAMAAEIRRLRGRRTSSSTSRCSSAPSRMRSAPSSSTRHRRWSSPTTSPIARARCAGAAQHLDPVHLGRAGTEASGLDLAGVIKAIRPELDLYVCPTATWRRSPAIAAIVLRPAHLLRRRGAAGAAPRRSSRASRRATRRRSSTI